MPVCGTPYLDEWEVPVGVCLNLLWVVLTTGSSKGRTMGSRQAFAFARVSVSTSRQSTHTTCVRQRGCLPKACAHALTRAVLPAPYTLNSRFTASRDTKVKRDLIVHTSPLGTLHCLSPYISLWDLSIQCDSMFFKILRSTHRCPLAHKPRGHRAVARPHSTGGGGWCDAAAAAAAPSPAGQTLPATSPQSPLWQPSHPAVIHPSVARPV